MSGHSKWSSIKHKKGAADARRGQLFTKLARAIAVAARDGGPDPEANSALALAVQKAKDARMPKENIERAIARATGSSADSEAIESASYEGYGPGGVAILVEALTDNRNRTSAEIRHLFSRHGGNLGEPGSVAWNFEKRGVILVDSTRYSEDDLMPAIDAGANDLIDQDGIVEVVSQPAELGAVRAALESAGIEYQSAEVTQRPINLVPITEQQAAQVMRLLEELEEHDDVSAVYSNFDADADVLERVLAS